MRRGEGNGLHFTECVRGPRFSISQYTCPKVSAGTAMMGGKAHGSCLMLLLTETGTCQCLPLPRTTQWHSRTVKPLPVIPDSKVALPRTRSSAHRPHHSRKSVKCKQVGRRVVASRAREDIGLDPCDRYCSQISYFLFQCLNSPILDLYLRSQLAVSSA